MKAFVIFVLLFVISVLLFFIGAAIGNVPMILAGIVLTLVLFVTRRAFIPRR